MYERINQQLLAFLAASPSPFHAVENIRLRLDREGFLPLSEGESWALKEGGKYYVTRNGSSIIAFTVPTREYNGFQICASHSDSPCFKLKENAEMTSEGAYTRLNVEKYGGMLCAPWFDRPLSIAGRVVLSDGERIFTRLVNIDRDLLIIPSLAIHMNRDANSGYSYNAQRDLLPILGDLKSKGQLMELVAEYAGVRPEQILSSDLFLYSRSQGTILGANNEYICAGQLDDLQCAFASLEGFLNAENSRSVPVLAVFDNEEVGSGTKQGALSTFLSETLGRINAGCGRSQQEYWASLAGSFMVSADNAHAVHPNLGGKADPVNRPRMNEGIVIKFNANQKYTSDAVSAALFRRMCGKAGVPCQVFTNRSDAAGGSTLGNLSNQHVSLNTVDIGLAQLAMHSAYETAGTADTAYLAQALQVMFSSCVQTLGDGSYLLLTEEASK